MTALLPERIARRWLRLHLPAHTIRLRLTVLYGAVFLAAGAGLLTITYFLVAHQYKGSFFIKAGKPAGLVVTNQTGPVAIGSVGVNGPGAAGLPKNVPTPEQVAAMADAQSTAALHQLLIQSGIALAIMAVIAVWLGWLVAGRALRPLRTITNAARDISASNLHRRLALAGPDDELKQLGNTFDDLLERLEAAFEAQRQFVANASHELRTPLTLERALVEVALADPNASVDTLRQTCERVLAAGEHQERLIEALLTLSRSQRGLELHEPVDLAAITAETLRTIDRDGLTIDAGLEPARTSGDPRLVERLVANLVNNAVRHNSGGGYASVTTRTTAGRAVVTVTNTGPVIPSDELDRLFMPFERLEGERTADADGVGLGLSIVQAIADAHAASVTARARRDGGLHVEVGFPAAGASLELD